MKKKGNGILKTKELCCGGLQTRYKLNTGTLTLRIGETNVESALFKVAERINPKRSFLFVSTVLGRHIPVRPCDHFSAVAELVKKVPDGHLDGLVLVMGYAETAVGIGAAVARTIAATKPEQPVLYLSSTRHAVPGILWFEFSEAHSHAIDHLVMRPPDHGELYERDVTLVLVDDETTTGATFSALLKSVRDIGVRVQRVLLLTLTDWSDGKAVDAVEQCLPGRPVFAFSLLRGAWKWERNQDVELPEVPGWGCGSDIPRWSPDHYMRPMARAPRLGLWMRNGSSPPMPDALPTPVAGEDVLVIGTGEHVWGPMLLAERLEQSGACVRFVATTRSPILLGKVIRHKIVFPDHFGIGVPMYLHNVPPRPDAHVVIVTETGIEGISSDLKAYLGHGHIIDGAGDVTEFRG